MHTFQKNWIAHEVSFSGLKKNWFSCERNKDIYLAGILRNQQQSKLHQQQSQFCTDGIVKQKLPWFKAVRKHCYVNITIESTSIGMIQQIREKYCTQIDTYTVTYCLLQFGRWTRRERRKTSVNRIAVFAIHVQVTCNTHNLYNSNERYKFFSLPRCVYIGEKKIRIVIYIRA